MTSWMFANDYMRAWSNRQNEEERLEGTVFAVPMVLRTNMPVSLLGVHGLDKQASVAAILGGQIGRGSSAKMPEPGCG